MSDSIADRFIDVMARIRDLNTENDNPMRHEVRALKNAAYSVIESAIREASNITFAAQGLSSSCAEAIKEALEKKGSSA